MPQMTFTDTETALHARVARRERFLADMDRLVPWAKLVQAIETVYPKNGRRGHPPIGAERMLRLYCIQLWFGLA